VDQEEHIGLSLASHGVQPNPAKLIVHGIGKWESAGVINIPALAALIGRAYKNTCVLDIWPDL
jgi:hypothetical protein